MILGEPKFGDLFFPKRKRSRLQPLSSGHPKKATNSQNCQEYVNLGLSLNERAFHGVSEKPPWFFVTFPNPN